MTNDERRRTAGAVTSFVLRPSSFVRLRPQPRAQPLVSSAQQEGDPFLHGRLDVGEGPEDRHAVAHAVDHLGQQLGAHEIHLVDGLGERIGHVELAGRRAPGRVRQHGQRQQAGGDRLLAQRAGRAMGAHRDVARVSRLSSAKRSPLPRNGASTAICCGAIPRPCTRPAISSATQSSISGW